MSAILKLSRSIGIHDGTFHADEVTACALLILFKLIDRDKVVRTRDVEKLAQCEYICDVGGIYDPNQKLFDHHQASYQGLLSSAGMILSYLKAQSVISDEEFKHFNHSLILGIDAHDNGRSKQEIGVTTFSHLIANFNPIDYASCPKELDEAFFEALDFVIGHLKRLHGRFRYNFLCRQSVKDAMQKGHFCLYFDRALPWMEGFFSLGGENHPALFVIMPAGKHWKLRGIPPNYEQRMQVRVSLPKKWGGLLENELKDVSGIEGAVFCHKGLFTSVWKTREDAIKALKYVLKENNITNEDTF